MTVGDVTQAQHVNNPTANESEKPSNTDCKTSLFIHGLIALTLAGSVLLATSGGFSPYAAAAFGLMFYVVAVTIHSKITDSQKKDVLLENTYYEDPGVIEEDIAVILSPEKFSSLDIATQLQILEHISQDEVNEAISRIKNRNPLFHGVVQNLGLYPKTLKALTLHARLDMGNLHTLMKITNQEQTRDIVIGLDLQERVEDYKSLVSHALRNKTETRPIIFNALAYSYNVSSLTPLQQLELMENINEESATRLVFCLRDQEFIDLAVHIQETKSPNELIFNQNMSKALLQRQDLLLPKQFFLFYKSLYGHEAAVSETSRIYVKS